MKGLLIFVGRHRRKAVDDQRQTVGNVIEGDLAFVFGVEIVGLQMLVDGVEERQPNRLVRGAAVLQKTGVVVVFQQADCVGKAERDVRFEFVFGLVLTVAPLCLHVPGNRQGQAVLADQFGEIVGDAVGIAVGVFRKAAVLLLGAEDKGDARIDDRLPPQQVLKKCNRNADIGEDLQVRLPMHHSTGAPGFFAGEGTLLQLAVHLALAESDGALGGTVVGVNLHVFRAVLRCAGAKTVKPQRIFVGRRLGVVVVFSSGVELAINQVPVPAPLGFVPAKRNAAPEILNRQAAVAIDGGNNPGPVPFARFVNGIGENFKKRVLAALQTVRAEDNGGTLADTVRTFEGFDALIVVLLWLFD